MGTNRPSAPPPSPVRLPGIRRLFLWNVVAVAAFLALAGYQYARYRSQRTVTLEELTGRVASATSEAELRRRGELLARATHAAHSSARARTRAVIWLGLGAAFVFLWNASALHELRAKAKAVDDEMADLHSVLASLPDEEDEGA